MRFIKITWVALSIGVLLLAACSSKSSTPTNIVRINSTNASGQQTTFVADSSNSVMSAFTNTIENRTVVQLCSDVDKDNDCSKLMVITVDGTDANDYAMDSPDSATTIAYHDDDAENGVINHYISTGGDVRVIENGSTLKGTFTANLECVAGCTGTTSISGTFSVDKM